VAVDVVSFGSEEANGEKLEAFHAAVNSNDNSHLVTVPPGTILSDMLFGTPIFMEEGAGGGGGEDGGEDGAPAAPRSEPRSRGRRQGGTACGVCVHRISACGAA
jgi:26S proteasome regulatory subunit N10